jgi:hypothetical protein
VIGRGVQVVRVLQESGLDALESFVRDWRRHFLETMAPQHLPSYWGVHNRVVNSSVNESADTREGAGVPCTQDVFSFYV